MRPDVLKKLQKLIKNSRNSYALELRGKRSYWSLSALTYTFYKDISSYISQNYFGSILDVGAGGLNGKHLFEYKCSSYKSLDIENRTGEIDFVEDIQDMKGVYADSFDSIYSSQVLEHVPSPQKAIAEIGRVIKNNGTCIISVPHISHYHEQPNDFFRFTEYGICSLLEAEGFTIERVYRQGGLISVITHPISILLISLTWHIPLIKWLIYYINKLIIVIPSHYLDKALHMSNIYPANIMVIAAKRK